MTPRQSPGRVLVVDDEPANVRLLERILQREDHEVRTAANGQQALEVIEQWRPEVVLLDLVMPELDGYGVVQRVRKAGEVDLPLLVLTADTAESARLRALELGASDVLLKPVDRLEVLLRVRNHLTLRRLSEQLREHNRSLTRDVVEQTGLLTQLQVAVDGVEDLVLLRRGDGRFAWSNAATHAAVDADPDLDERLQSARDGDTVETADRRVLDVRRRVVHAGGTEIEAVVARDVTERVRTAQALESTLRAERQAADRLARLQELQDNLMRAAAHELRTPLAKVQGAVAILHQQPGSVEAEMLEILERGATELGTIVDGLLDFQRLTETGDAPNQVRVLRALVTQALDGLDVGARRIDLGDLDHRVLVEPDQVQRAILNLLTNAVRHTPADATVRVAARTWGDRVVLHVEDDGPGVPDDRKQAIFEPFTQVRHGFTNRRGVGLGLALVASVAQTHGGYADVVDGPSGGSVFRLALPSAGSQNDTTVPEPG